MDERKNLLFEIGTEELPPKSLKKIARALQNELVSQLKKYQLIGYSVDSSVYATPRRLAVSVCSVAVKQPDQIVDMRGPALTAAFDNQGKPTQAAVGFARSVGVSIDELKTQKTNKGEWLFYQVHRLGQPAKELIPASIEKALNALPIARRMRWSDSKAEFIRPVHWMVILHGDKVIECEILSVKSDRFTYGHRFHANGRLKLSHADNYENLLEQKGFVIADFEKRREQIFKEITALARTRNGRVLLDDALLDEVTGIVELPVPLVGEIDLKFLNLPQEVLVSSMRNHQKYFHIVEENDKILPFFITVSNIRSTDEARVIAGNERVLQARLSDAQFFWDKDRSTSLEQRISVLDNVLFHRKLGSLSAKSSRINELCKFLSEKLGADKELACRCALLCKTDLVTDMVGEFPELQGIMGNYYALNDGEHCEVAKAIEEHYLPRFAGDRTPLTLTGSVVAIADKLDTICGIFASDEAPTGDKDPFGLRRAALGILRILLEAKIELDLKQAIAVALQGYLGKQLHVSCHQDIYNFIFERLKKYYQEIGFDTRLYQAVAATRPVSPVDFDQRLKAVSEFAKQESAKSLIEANKRIGNILHKAKLNSIEIDQTVLQETQEVFLFKRLQSIKASLAPLLKENNYSEILITLSILKQPVDDFFDNIMVMDEDMVKRKNRIALLSQINQLFKHVADISYLR